MMDAFCIYSSSGKALIENVFRSNSRKELLSDLRDLLMNKCGEKYCLILNNDQKHTHQFLRRKETNFVYLLRKDNLMFVAYSKNEHYPVMIVEMVNELIQNLRDYFSVEKLHETILLNNYSIVNFLINEILSQGRPSLFVDEILKNLVKSESALLNETLKITPIPSSLYNMIIQKKNPLKQGFIKDQYVQNINPSFSDGTSLNSQENQYNYWRVSNNDSSTNEIFIDVIDNVQCILSSSNRILHYAVNGQVVVNAVISGSPSVKLFIKNLNINRCNFHFCVNYPKLVKNRIKRIEEGAKENEEVICFVPLSKEFIVLKYFYIHQSKKKEKNRMRRITYEDLTDVLNTKTETAAKDNPSKEEAEVENELNEDNQETITKEEGKENITMNLLPLDTMNYNELMTGEEFEIEEESETINKLLPISLEHNVTFIKADHMYKIKITVKLNNINPKTNSNELLQNYEDLYFKIPLHNFISTVTFQCSLGIMNYNDLTHNIHWYIKNVGDRKTPIHANLFLYVKKNEHSMEYQNIQDYSTLIYPSFNFVVYASLKVNKISVSGKKIEKIEIQDTQNMDIYKGCRYTTYFNNMEFRL